MRKAGEGKFRWIQKGGRKSGEKDSEWWFIGVAFLGELFVQGGKRKSGREGGRLVRTIRLLQGVVLKEGTPFQKRKSLKDGRGPRVLTRGSLSNKGGGE